VPSDAVPPAARTTPVDQGRLAGPDVLASANRDSGEFADPDTFDPQRFRNRHVAFGAGPHRCVGSNLARMNLRVAIEEVVDRLDDIRLAPDADIDFHSTFNRAPLTVPITFTGKCR
jgi:cytochrome P450